MRETPRAAISFFLSVCLLLALLTPAAQALERVQPGDMLAEGHDNSSFGFNDFDGYYADALVRSGAEIPVERLEVLLYGDRWRLGDLGAQLTIEGGATIRGEAVTYPDGVFVSFPLQRPITGRYEVYVSIRVLEGDIDSALAYLVNGRGGISSGQGADMSHKLDSDYQMSTDKNSVLQHVLIVNGDFTSRETSGQSSADRQTPETGTAQRYPLLATPVLSRQDAAVANRRTMLLQDAQGNLHHLHEEGEGVAVTVYDAGLGVLRSLTLPKLMQNFGTAAIDAEGNYYIASGKWVTEEQRAEHNVAIGKYSAAGAPLGSAAFVGGEGYHSGTKNPFNTLASMAVSGRTLALHFSRLMFQSYDGLNHQSSTVLYVDIDSMTPLDLPTLYVSHSFGQQVIPTRDGGFLFADLGDASPRGFEVSALVLGRMFGFTSFHFRELTPYQSTNSALGGIAEGDRGYLLAGSSERSLSYTPIPAGEGGPQDLFVQLLKKDFYAHRDNRDRMLLTGETRTPQGVYSADRAEGQRLYLPNNIEDAGVVWLTAYPQGESARNPKLAATEQGFLLLWEHWGRGDNQWESYIETMVMVLEADGSVAKQATAVPGNPRLGTDRIHYSEGPAIWAATDEGDCVIYTLAVDDRPSLWAAEQVQTAAALGLVPQALQSGYAQPATRAEFCALGVALYEKYSGKEITQRMKFDDTADAAVEKLAAIGVVEGVGNNRFAPDQPLNREQAAAVLARLAAALGAPLEAGQADFADRGDIGAWALPSVGQVQAAGIMGGVGGGSFAPGGAYTREQSMVTMLRLWTVLG